MPCFNLSRMEGGIVKTSLGGGILSAASDGSTMILDSAFPCGKTFLSLLDLPAGYTLHAPRFRLAPTTGRITTDRDARPGSRSRRNRIMRRPTLLPASTPGCCSPFRFSPLGRLIATKSHTRPGVRGHYNGGSFLHREGS